MSSAQDLTTTVLDGRYRLTRLMGEGGMGQVYEGMHEMLDRKVAVKVLLPRFAFDPKFRERFLREAKAASKVRHPNVVQILDFGDTPNGSVYFAMEFLEGHDLQGLLKQEGPLSWSRARHLLLQMTSALGAAHEHKIIHRDIKPANFFVIEARGHQEFVKVLDFGIAKIGTAPGGEDSSQAQSLTGTGEVFGTAKYMAPEQAFGASNDPRVDVYSLGIVAYEMLTGSVPFKGSSVFEIITRHVNDRPAPPRSIVPEIPEAVEAAILRAIAKRPEDRFDSMDQMGQVLAAIDGEAMPLTHSRPPPSAEVRPVPAPAVLPAPAPMAPGHAGVVQRRPEVRSDVVTASGSGRGPVPPSRGPSTSVMPTRLKVPSSVAAGEVMGPAVMGPAVMAPPRRVAEDASHGGSTAPVRGMGDVGSSTGPGDSRLPSGQMVGTESFLPMTGPYGTTSRPKGMVLGGLLATLVVGGGAVAGVIASSGEDAFAPTVAGAPALVERVEVEVGPVAEEVPAVPTAPPEPEPTVVIEADPEPSTPQPEPARPKTSKPKTSKPLTDSQVKSKLARSLEKKCRSSGSGSVTVELLVGSDGRVLSKSAPGTSGDLKKCLIDGVAKAAFPDGTTRKVSIPVSF